MRFKIPVAALAAATLSAGCDDPTFLTDLNAEGAPEVTLVTVSTAGGEAPTFCLSGEEHKVNRDLCPEDPDQPGVRSANVVTNVVAEGWYARVVFSERLDVSVETIVTDDEGARFGSLAETQPVALECEGAEVAYDGFYDPSGNDVSDPAGPSLVIQTLAFVGTGAECAVSVKDLVKDKDGLAVEESMRGPFEFQIEPLSYLGSDPAQAEAGEASAEVPVSGTLTTFFNAPIDMDSVMGSMTLFNRGLVVPFTLSVDGSTVVLTPDEPLTAGLQYVWTFDVSGFTDTEGGELVEPAMDMVTFIAVEDEVLEEN